jgi:hypothetical protein
VLVIDWTLAQDRAVGAVVHRHLPGTLVALAREVVDGPLHVARCHFEQRLGHQQSADQQLHESLDFSLEL